MATETPQGPDRQATDGQWYPTPVNGIAPQATQQGAPVAIPQHLATKSASVVGNILWLLIAGIWLAIGYVIAGCLNMLTIIGIPFGIQSFKLAGYALWPFGRVVVQRPGSDAGLSTLGNVIWFI